jgi:hypothetical protein
MSDGSDQPVGYDMKHMTRNMLRDIREHLSDTNIFIESRLVNLAFSPDIS